MSVLKGYSGRGLRVNPSDEEISKETLDSKVLKKYLGGAGLGTKILFDELESGIDPLAGENKLIFLTGPLNGTLMPLAKGHIVVSKSPLSGTVCKSSSGGLFGAEMKSAGFDYIILEGKSETPVYLLVSSNGVEIKDAQYLWGKTTHETEDLIKNREQGNLQRAGERDVCVSSIGPAGENLVRFACIINEKHNAAGRGGLGAVMGSKKVKAIAVRGRKDIPIANVNRLVKLREEMLDKMKDSSFGEGFSKFGTTDTVPVANIHGIYPTRNFQEGVFEPFEDFDPKEIVDKYAIRDKSCFGCPIHCNKVVKLTNNSGETITDRQEYETFFALGGNCGNSDIEKVILSGDKCNRLGVDTISMGVTISFAFELAQKGILNKNIDGLKMEWGNTESISFLIEKIAYRDGFGDLLADGSARAAEQLGKRAEKYAMTVKNMEIAGYDPRGAKGIGLTYAVASRGACHKFAYTLKEEMWTGKVDRFTEKGKAELVKNLSDINSLLHSAIICTFPMDQSAFGLEEIKRGLKHVTGWNFTEKSLLRVGERTVNLQRLFNIREGFTYEDDTLPERFLKEPLKDGPAKGKTVDLDKMLSEYYKLRGWNAKGEPKKGKLNELNIS
ncbi:hypothetical protein AKJ38_00275 [candidate division MSBL1 archaeon SCGC-AAA259I14]|uniref:Aldehyde ferredoxin oxidoreductase N-terminal domain-containing protein n=1 Tax=candidate division MSBL1 archaeon SCGC-AAA259I14 TaxID=1698268 RepID=A0A133UU97_9EURY|nr:hypothetical protein AKJ38_00275 [candidate division MSBL1 archaeon SCGC-AAA259I14]